MRLNKERIRQEERLDGKYLISTSDESLTPEDVALGCQQFAEIGADFRSLKQTLEMRPVYHRLEDRSGPTSCSAGWLSCSSVSRRRTRVRPGRR